MLFLSNLLLRVVVNGLPTAPTFRFVKILPFYGSPFATQRQTTSSAHRLETRSSTRRQIETDVKIEDSDLVSAEFYMALVRKLLTDEFPPHLLLYPLGNVFCLYLIHV